MPTSPREHAQEIRDKLEDLKDRMRSAIEQIDDPHAEALFETSAEVVEGLLKAHAHFVKASEEAWRS